MACHICSETTRCQNWISMIIPVVSGKPVRDRRLPLRTVCPVTALWTALRTRPFSKVPSSQTRLQALLLSPWAHTHWHRQWNRYSPTAAMIWREVHPYRSPERGPDLAVHGTGLHTRRTRLHVEPVLYKGDRHPYNKAICI